MPLELYSRLFKLPTPPNHEWWWWKEAKKKFSLWEWMRKFLNIFATLARKMRWRRRWSDGKLNGKKFETAESWLTLMEIILLRVQKKRDRRIIWKVIKFDLRVLCAGIIPTLSMALELCGSWREFDFFFSDISHDTQSPQFAQMARGLKVVGRKAQVNTDKAPLDYVNFGKT